MLDINDHEVLGDVSNSGIQQLEDVADITFTGIYNGGERSGLGALMDLMDMDDDGFDDIVFGSGVLPGNSGMVAFKGGISHITGPVDLETAIPDISYGYSDLTSFDVGDTDGNGEIDLATAGAWGSGRLYRNVDSSNISIRGYSGGGHDTPVNYQYADHVLLEDLDGDGLDEVISGYFFNNPLMEDPPPHSIEILWGTGEQTSLTNGDFKMLGSSIRTGDIDGDNNTDLIIGEYTWDDEDRYLELLGSIYLVFNASSLKNVGTSKPGEVARCQIIGTTERDYLGFSIEVMDLNGDGKDDIIAGSPGSDDPLNIDYDCGALHIFYGDVQESFPTVMESNGGADLIVYGANGKVTGDRRYSGDGLGRMFEIADIDGDNEYELITTTSSKNLDSGPSQQILSAGEMMFYETDEVFASGGKFVKLDDPSDYFTVNGMDPFDSTGWQLETGDVNGDNVSDVLVSVPGGDGLNNFRPECGEVYLILGESLRIDGLKLSGGGMRDGSILPGSGEVELNLSYIQTKGFDKVGRVNFTLDPEVSMINISVNEDGTTLSNDRFDSIKIISYRSGGNNNIGWRSVSFEVGWTIPMIGSFDISVKVEDQDGREVEMKYDRISRVDKNVAMGNDWNIVSEDDVIRHQWDWCSGNSILKVTDLEFEYANFPDLKISPGNFGFGLFDDARDLIDLTFDENGYLEFRAQDMGLNGLDMEPILQEAVFDTSFPDKYYPKFVNTERIEVSVDSEKPMGPDSITIYKDSQVQIGDTIPDDGVVALIGSSIGVEKDSYGSGIRTIEMRTGSDEYQPLMEKGGLYGTYWQDSEFGTVGDEVVDDMIDFNWNDGFGPYDRNVPSNDFSIRWHGWVMNVQEHPVTFRLIGRSEARLELDGEVMIPWSSIIGGISSNPVELETDSMHELIIHYRLDDEGNSFPVSGIELQWSIDGRFATITEDFLYHPTNISSIDTSMLNGDARIQARSVDWVGYVSEDVTRDVVIDRTGPIFQPVKIPQWTQNIHQEIIINISDSVSGSGSGVDPETVQYRMMDENGFAHEWLGPDRIRTSIKGLSVSCYPELNSVWRGTIQFRADDNYGNPSLSEFYPLNVDVKGPQIDLTGGPSFDLKEVGPVTIPIRVIDRGGSGVDGDSIEIRINDNGDGWGNWKRFGTGPIGEDIRINGSLFLGGGNYEIQFRAYDVVRNVGVSEEYWISLSVPEIDLPPLAVIRLPANGSRFPMNIKVELDSEGTEDDHLVYDDLEISWWSNISGYIGSGGKIFRYLPVGNHTITLRVSDGRPGHNISTSVFLIIYEPGNGGSSDTDNDDDDPLVQDEPDDITWMVLLASLIGIIIIGIIFFLFFRSRDQDEMIINIRERTQDDEDDHEEWS